MVETVLNIEQVHDVIMNRVSCRGCGKTIAMLTEAVGMADFNVRETYILCGNMRNIKMVQEQLIWVAGQLGHTVTVLPFGSVKIADTFFYFRNILLPVEDDPCTPVFFDNIFYEAAPTMPPDTYEAWMESEELSKPEKFPQYILGEWVC